VTRTGWPCSVAATVQLFHDYSN